MGYQDPHRGAIYTPKSSTWDETVPCWESEEMEQATFYICEVEGNKLFDLLKFAEEFFMNQGELFTTYEEFWLRPHKLEEFLQLYKIKKNAQDTDEVKFWPEFKKLGEFIEIAKKNKQPIIFVT